MDWAPWLHGFSWPPRSPDLNPLDFFFWGCLNEKVYSKPISNIIELRQRVSEAVEEINSRDYIRLIKISFLHRYRTCIDAGRKQFEHLL